MQCGASATRSPSQFSTSRALLWWRVTAAPTRSSFRSRLAKLTYAAQLTRPAKPPDTPSALMSAFHPKQTIVPTSCGVHNGMCYRGSSPEIATGRPVTERYFSALARGRQMMEKVYWLSRKRASLEAARNATSSEARLIHYDLAGRYSLKAMSAKTHFTDLAQSLPAAISPRLPRSIQPRLQLI